MDTEGEVDRVGGDADFLDDLPDAVGEAADHDGYPLVRLLELGQHLLDLLTAAEDEVDARPIDRDAIHDLLRRNAVHIATVLRLKHIGRARLVAQLCQTTYLCGASLVVESLR